MILILGTISDNKEKIVNIKVACKWAGWDLNLVTSPIVYLYTTCSSWSALNDDNDVILDSNLPVELDDLLLVLLITTLFQNVVKTATEWRFKWSVHHWQRTSLKQIQLLNLHQSHVNKHKTQCTGLKQIQLLNLHQSHVNKHKAQRTGLTQVQLLNLHQSHVNKHKTQCIGLTQVQLLNLHQSHVNKHKAQRTGLTQVQLLNLHQSHVNKHKTQCTGLTQVQLLDLHQSHVNKHKAQRIGLTQVQLLNLHQSHVNKHKARTWQSIHSGLSIILLAMYRTAAPAEAGLDSGSSIKSSQIWPQPNF